MIMIVKRPRPLLLAPPQLQRRPNCSRVGERPQLIMMEGAGDCADGAVAGDDEAAGHEDDYADDDFDEEEEDFEERRRHLL